ncbi:glycine cleavage system aminomethyltransferase GcvT [Frankia sp. CNm7]|uniref:Aminomethyltransferase n=1 Tax=Frankia nepalensis TaxID=1836974 RepID=A0A937UTH7_9ACTN|nr:glycine cleavage system aminomethyltransferase GcvT [Frankia nepalensis]MBL7500691.1 glycine cleavage system aminomethyltransferase GcvT [Frankia nepalensis]MBL7513123.1 glycine cleavage system aminomethyltransferase GcvT [Frankia nepalensis]MBL7524651.1 glycine cleavage system aminomethyltransferase GcvT [Frankia nepalensis]MBL7633602.1 glycine cleavage system aminomethyltransferase GcvT [Frankia nepalensis]
MADENLLRTPLFQRHVDAGAKLASFGGWEMPIEYAGGGVLAEHRAVREAVGVFDVSHLGKGRVTGQGAAEFVNASLTNDLARIGQGQAQYTLCCDESGGVVDDLITYLRGAEDVFLVPNAANTTGVVRRLADAAPPGIEVANLHTAYGVLAVQGPRSADVLAALGLPADGNYMTFRDAERKGRPVMVCRSGYTGELGFELLPRWDDTAEVWDAVLAAARGLGGRACGLGARDTLRTEMGYPLHGQDLSLSISPLRARAGWAVGWGKERFWGRDALLAERAAGPAQLLWGLRSTDRGIPRPHMRVLDATGADVGEVTSGTFSPTLRAGIGLALLDRAVQEGAEVSVDVRGRRSTMTVARPPFVPSSPK